ncbi:hypothetical protein V6N12_034454 [Hibiscus sabdariffa]|uniref:RNase H type-1 domain-containing protein n=1 Tax=Hibiscus sabdariffa TaxID=183260 RepID=A0ABR2DH76_9ROSI
MGASVGGTNKQINSPVVLQSPVVRVNEHQGVKFNLKQHDNSGSGNTSSGVSLDAKVVAMVPSRVPAVLFKDASGSTLQHQAITIVEEGDGREEGIGSISRAGLKGVVNIRSDTSRRRIIYGDDITEKPSDDPGCPLSCISVRPAIEKPFQYVFAWQENPGFQNELLRSWDHGATIMDNLQSCSVNFATWNDSVFGHVGNLGFTYNVRGSFPMCPSRLGSALTASFTSAVRPPSALVSDSIGWSGDDRQMFTVKSAYSLHADGSRNISTGLASCGGVGRHSESRWCFGFAKDSCEAYETIMSSNSRKVESSILSSIFELLSRPWEAHVAFVRREGNVVADAISRLVLSDSLEYRRWLEVPLAVQDLVLADGNFEALIQTQFSTQRAYDDPGGR